MSQSKELQRKMILLESTKIYQKIDTSKINKHIWALIQIALDKETIKTNWTSIKIVRLSMKLLSVLKIYIHISVKL